jgi:hypothetical protein
MSKYSPPKLVSSLFNLSNFNYNLSYIATVSASVALDNEISTSFKEENPTATFIDYVKNMVQRTAITHIAHFWYATNMFGGISTYSPSIQYMTEPEASWVISDQNYYGASDFDTTVDNPFIWLEYRKRFLNQSLTNEDKIFATGPVTRTEPTEFIPSGLRNNTTGYLELNRSLPSGLLYEQSKQFTIIFSLYRHTTTTRSFNFYLGDLEITSSSSGVHLFYYNSALNTFTSTGIQFASLQPSPANMVTVGISFDFVGNRFCLGSQRIIFELVSGVSSTRHRLSRPDSMEPVSMVPETGDVINIANSLVDWSDGTFIANNGSINSFPPITGFGETCKLLIGRRRDNATPFANSQLNECRFYNTYMDNKTLAQNIYFIRDSAERRKKPMTLS